jgi:hypothetical protein
MDVLVVILVVVVLAAGFVFIRAQTKAQGRWGINPLRTFCPRCGTRLPMIRKPATREEALFGGWTCPQCRCQVDKYGRERGAG